MVEQMEEMNREIEKLKSEMWVEDNSTNKFEQQLESFIHMDSFDRKQKQKVIKKVVVNINYFSC